MEDNPQELIPMSEDRPVIRTVWYNGKLYFSLIDIVDYMHTGAFGLPIKAHKTHKHLTERDNLRDHMTPAELGLQAFTEGLANTLHQSRNSQGYKQIFIDVTDAGRGGSKARETAEEILGEPLVSSKNYKQIKGVSKKKALPSSAKPPASEQLSLFDLDQTEGSESSKQATYDNQVLAPVGDILERVFPHTPSICLLPLRQPPAEAVGCEESNAGELSIYSGRAR